ncbi:MAG: hypothetical protein Crog4KO_09120 [Crocinitomicaceae bacterium]
MKNYVNLEETNYQNQQSILAHRDALQLLLEMLQENELLQARFGSLSDDLTSFLELLIELIDQNLE